jgi:CSLREA domain-containing protein
VTSAAGQTSVTATGNGTTGSYSVTASYNGLSAIFRLTNQAIPGYVVNTTADSYAGAFCGSPCSLRDALAAISHTARFCGEPRSAAVMESHSTARNRLRDRVVGVAEEHIADRSRCWRIAPPGCCATCVEKGCWVAAENFSSGARRRPLRRFASKDRLSSVPATRAVR